MSKEASPLNDKMASSVYFDRSQRNGSNVPSDYDKVPNSPNHKKLKEMTQDFKKMNEMQRNDKQSRLMHIEKSISDLEAGLANTAGYESKFRFFRDELNSLQEGLNDSRISMVYLNEKLSKDAENCEEKVKGQTDHNAMLGKEVETKITKGQDEKIFNLHVTHSRLGKQYEDEFSRKVEEIKNFLSDIKEGIECESYQREEGIDLLTGQIQNECQKVATNLQDENNSRVQNSNKINAKFTEVYNTLQDEIAHENQVRQDSSDAILRLLEETLNKLDRKNIQNYY